MSLPCQHSPRTGTGSTTVSYIPCHVLDYFSIVNLTAPTFVSMHEIGDYIYVFFQEEALEAPEQVKTIICKIIFFYFVFVFVKASTVRHYNFTCKNYHV